MASYATPAQLLTRYDARRVGQLATDTGAMLAARSLDTDPNVLAALADASGQIEAAILVGNRYRVTDLTSLTGNTLNLLIRLTCDLAFGYLIRRRGMPEAEAASLAPGYREAQGILERMRAGDMVFGVQAVLDAKKTKTQLMGSLTTGATGIVVLAERYFGVPASQTFGTIVSN